MTEKRYEYTLTGFDILLMQYLDSIGKKAILVDNNTFKVVDK